MTGKQPPKLMKSRALRCAAQVLITGTIAVCICFAVYELVHQLETAPQLISLAFALSMALAVMYRVINAYGWALVMNAMGDPVDAAAATRIWLLAESRRWLPGGVWGYTSRAAMAQRIDVPITKASASMFIELMMVMAAAVLVSIPGVILYWSEVAGALQELTKDIPTKYLIAVAIVGVSIAPFVWKKFGNKAKALQKRYESLKGISLKPAGLAKSLCFFVGMGVLNGLVSGCLLKAMPGAADTPFTIVVAATSVAWVIGFLAVFSPGGLIVREGALALLLAPWLPYSTGFTLAILARLVQIFAEVVCMAWVLGIEYRRGGLAKTPTA